MGAGDLEKRGERRSGGQLWDRHLLIRDRVLDAHAHIVATKSGFIISRFWVRCVSPVDT
jgi:hypothetical protein